MALISEYRFGLLIFNGVSYKKDLLIYPDLSVLYPWWRRSGHKLELEDIGSVLETQPDIIIAGTGAQGLMHPSSTLLNRLDELGIDFIALPSAKAVNKYNKISGKQKVAGCFHLTC